MGIGYPLDIVLCTALGADMYDSVYPTRTARFGVALIEAGQLKLRNKAYEADFRRACRAGSYAAASITAGSVPSSHVLHA